MKKIFIMGMAHKKIPYREIFMDLSSRDIYLALPDESYSEKDLKKIENQYGKFFTYYSQNQNPESFCYELYQSTPYDRLIAPLESDILWAGRLRDLLSIPGQSYKSALLFRDKFLMKKHVKKFGFKTPSFAKIESESDLLAFIEKEKFPVLVKPRRGTASEGIYILKNFEEVKIFSKNNISLQHENHFLAESYILGNVYQIDGLVKNGKLIFAWPSATIRRCLDICSGSAVGRHFLSDQHPLLKGLLQYAKNIIETFPTGDAMIFHLECFHENKNNFTFCEIASRVGGLRGRDTWIESFGIDLGKEAMRAQADLPLSVTVDSELKPKNISGYILFPKRDGFLQSMPLDCSVPGVIEYTPFIKPKESYQKSNGLRDIACVIVLSAPSEELFFKYFQKSLIWYENSYLWKKTS